MVWRALLNREGKNKQTGFQSCEWLDSEGGKHGDTLRTLESTSLLRNTRSEERPGVLNRAANHNLRTISIGHAEKNRGENSDWSIFAGKPPLRGIQKVRK